MAVPNDLTTLNFSGVFVLNKTLSDNKLIDKIIELQGVNWVVRKAIGIATLTLYIKHFKEDDILEHIDIGQKLTGGIPAPPENIILDWTTRMNDDGVFGPVTGRTRRTKVDVLDSDFLKKNWTLDTLEHGVVQSYDESDTPKSKTTWIANQTWGIEEIDGERRYTRHVKFTGPKGQDIECRMVYDYLRAL